MNRHLAHADTISSAATTTAESSSSTRSCVDRAAMEANANLVGQVHDYKGRLALAQDHKREAEARAAGLENGPHSRLMTSREEWGRMAREGTVRIRVPCTSWDSGGGGFSLRKATPSLRVGTTSNNIERRSRADAAGLSPEELEMLTEAYGRTRSRMWAAMRSTCEANTAYREAMDELKKTVADDKEKENVPSSEVDDDVRISLCRSSIIDLTEASSRTAITRTAELHAAGAGIDKATSDGERVLFALTAAAPTLFDEMTRALGKEKATRAVDNGVLCLDETVYDVRTPEAAPTPMVRASEPSDEPPNEEPEG